jgi:hypothetical protein
LDKFELIRSGDERATAPGAVKLAKVIDVFDNAFPSLVRGLAIHLDDFDFVADFSHVLTSYRKTCGASRKG